ncbi:asl0090 [Nostoc sp. PCC 7120 = FACHB-418]|nr:asl0090 [Nostoc sp. PCC 7120 = FACHB-418]
MQGSQWRDFTWNSALNRYGLKVSAYIYEECKSWLELLYLVLSCVLENFGKVCRWRC